MHRIRFTGSRIRLFLVARASRCWKTPGVCFSLEVDESCFVVGIGSCMLQRVVADVARPAGMIWCDMQGGE